MVYTSLAKTVFYTILARYAYCNLLAIKALRMI